MNQPLNLERYQRIVILTGAGVSAASGMPTFRGPGGLWSDQQLARLSDASIITTDIAAMWQFFGGLRKSGSLAKPNPGHMAVAHLESLKGGERQITVVTQNVDGLHQVAGSTDVVELHGSLVHTRCVDPKCSAPRRFDGDDHRDAVPTCAVCGQPERPDVVLFNEMIPAEADYRTRKALRDCDIFVAAGTSGTVFPAASFVRSAAYAGARTVLVNLEPMQPRDPAFQEEYLGKAEELLPVLLAVSERR